jgi:hypothetical protein
LATKTFTVNKPTQLKGRLFGLGLKLKVDEKEIPVNEFVEKILNGMIVGAVTSLRGIHEDWKKIEVEITK